ncbi:hypothetical protein IEQ34_022282 [Dendrobium chrysotoxum]|uniref:Uncharacterized protein n=1 Tax=Dendrobium chrysotoxum TaxID=161865 RepID=A0AAV7FX66_DENCH|nr:hypothetical protein IEQ34_022282 [Dendrobium chrysotoxum]
MQSSVWSFWVPIRSRQQHEPSGYLWTATRNFRTATTKVWTAVIGSGKFWTTAFKGSEILDSTQNLSRNLESNLGRKISGFWPSGCKGTRFLSGMVSSHLKRMQGFGSIPLTNIGSLIRQVKAQTAKLHFQSSLDCSFGGSSASLKMH